MEAERWGGPFQVAPFRVATAIIVKVKFPHPRVQISIFQSRYRSDPIV